MNITVHVALIGWPLVVLAMFATMKPRYAVIAAFIGAWLFLPVGGYSLPGLTSYTKMTATSVSVLLAVALFDGRRLMLFRPSWIDVPMAVWCVVPMASSVANGLGVYDGGSAVAYQTISWGLPYFIGRLYFSDLEGLRVLAVGVFIGGLVYMPFCLWEIRMSPQLHVDVYGYRQHSWTQTLRFGGYRPMVFMQHGLMVGMWMCMATLVGLWLWWSGAQRRLWGVPMPWLVVPLGMTAVLCKSFGALVLLVGGVGVLVALKWFRMGIVVLALAMVPPAYMAVRAPGLYDGRHLVEFADAVAPERTGSLQYRLDAEEMLAEHAMRQPVFGWGGWGRNRPARMGDEETADMATDGFWVITLGQRGLVGLTAVYAVLLLPGFVLWRRWRSEDWVRPTATGAGALAVVLTLYAVDSLFNAMVNPVYTVVAGGLLGVVAMQATASRVRTTHEAPRVTREKGDRN